MYITKSVAKIDSGMLSSKCMLACDITLNAKFQTANWIGRNIQTITTFSILNLSFLLSLSNVNKYLLRVVYEPYYSQSNKHFFINTHKTSNRNHYLSLKKLLLANTVVLYRPWIICDLQVIVIYWHIDSSIDLLLIYWLIIVS